MNKASSVLIVLSLTFMIFGVPLAICSPCELIIDPSLVEKYAADVSTTFDVDVKVVDITNLYAFDLNITWDNSMITLVQAMFATQLDDMWGSGNWFIGINQKGAGYYKLVVTATSPAKSYNGTHVLVTLRFHVECTLAGQTAIHFDTHKLSDPTATAISHTATDGTYKMLEDCTPPPGPVGGTWTFADKLALATPWIASVVLILSALGAGLYFMRIRTKGKQ